MRTCLSAAVAALGLLLLAGCAAVAPRPAGDWLKSRQAWFQRHPDWSVDGRMALSDGQRGGSLALHWQARGERHEIALRTLAGGQQWRLMLGPDGAVLVGSEVGRLEGPDPDLLVEQAVGWPIPVRHMADWLRGLPAPAAAQIRFGEDGLMVGLDWADWHLEYQRWAGWGNGAVRLPARIEARRGPHRVRLALGAWQFAAAEHGPAAR